MTIDGYNKIFVKPGSAKAFEYVVVGNAATAEGLSAPYHEEQTTELGKIEQLSSGVDLFEAWQENANTNRYEALDVEYASLSRP